MGFHYRLNRPKIQQKNKVQNELIPKSIYVLLLNFMQNMANINAVEF